MTGSDSLEIRSYQYLIVRNYFELGHIPAD